MTRQAFIPAQALQLSVVVAASDPSPQLPQTLDSLFAQTFGPIEVIVVADESRGDMLAGLALIDDPRLTIARQAKHSLVSARNTGILLSRAPLVAFCAADDLWEPTKAERHRDVLESDPIAGITFSYAAGAGTRGKTGGAPRKLERRDPTARDLILRNPIPGASTVVMRREIFRLAGLFHEELGSWTELEMWVRAAARTPYTVRRLPEVLQRSAAPAQSRSSQAECGELFVHLERALECFRDYVPGFTQGDADRGAAACLRGASRAARANGELEIARALLQRARTHHPSVLRRCLGLLGVGSRERAVANPPQAGARTLPFPQRAGRAPENR